MSIDFVIVCDPCKAYVHLGYRSGLMYHFGSNEAGREDAGEFIIEHADCHSLYQQGGGERCGLRVVVMDCDSYRGYTNEGDD